MSGSQYLAELIRREVGAGWAEGFFEEVIGGWKDSISDKQPPGYSSKLGCESRSLSGQSSSATTVSQGTMTSPPSVPHLANRTGQPRGI
jgi:hypothetical protein